MATGSDEIIVDEMQSPEGALRLVAYEQDGLLWIGVRSGLSTLGGALALHSGSDDHYVEAAGEGRGTWALVWGAVAPEIERVAVQDAQGQAVPATIIPLPDAFGESFRAAWGLAEPDTGSASLVGYDRRGRLVDANAIRPREPTSSTPMARLEQLRVQAHEALRYHATAYLAANDVE